MKSFVSFVSSRLVRWGMISLLFAVSRAMAAAPEPPVAVDKFALEGEIDGENIVFSLSLEAQPAARKSLLPVVNGDVAYLDGRLPRGAEVVRDGSAYLIRLASTRRQPITFRFASRPIVEGEWRRTFFTIPGSSVRKLSLICDRADLEVRFPGALEVTRGKAANGKPCVTAYLGITNRFEVAWKPEVKRLQGELAASCEANSIVSTGIGALKMDQVFTYRVIQGSLTRLVLLLPGVNVTQVRGDDIQDWRIEKPTPDTAKLIVTLSRPREDVYRLQVLSEMSLPKFPTRFTLPVIVPENVIRTSGFLLIGTDSAIKLQIPKIAGLTQMDSAAFAAGEPGPGEVKRLIPSRPAAAYQFANMPYTAEVAADDVTPLLNADCRHVLTLAENELSFSASIEVDVRDAPAREILLETMADPGWTVTGVTGQHVSEPDVDVRDTGTVRVIEVPFKQAVSGTTLVQVQMQKTLTAGDAAFSVPSLRVVGARAERGYLVVAAEKGMRLKTGTLEGLREVHTGSAPMRVENAQLAFRFKEAGWKAALSVERTTPSLHAEVFHVVSLGEGVQYCSAAITFHIGAAPLQELRLRIPAAIQNVEITGADVEGWKRNGDECVVRLQARVMGDYTLLVTYDRQYPLPTADIHVGTVETVGAESEVGYIAVASSLNLNLNDVGESHAALIRIDREELPPEYSTLVTAPILRSYRYVRTPHAAQLHVQMLNTEQLIGQVADYVKLSTVLSRDGEAVTTAEYFIKNATLQFFSVTLPPGAKLWAVKSVSESGVREGILSQESGSKLLIPVARPRDPNTAIRLEVTYAQSCGALGFWRGGLRGVSMAGPVLPDAHATFAGWSVLPPEKFVISEAGGNMTVEGAGESNWLAAVLRTALRMGGALADGWGQHRFSQACTDLSPAQQSVELSRTVNLRGMEPVYVNLRVAPRWIGSAGSVRGLLAAAGCAVILLPFALMGGFVMRALFLTALLTAIGQLQYGRTGLALVIVAFGLYLLARLLLRGLRLIRSLWRAITSPLRDARERRHQRRAIKAVVAADDLPLEPVLPTQEPEGGSTSGFMAVRLLVALAALAAFVMCASAQSVTNAAQKAMDSVALTVDAPKGARDVEQSARVTAEYRFEATEAGFYNIAPPESVVLGMELGSDQLAVRTGPSGYVLEVREAGKYTAKVTFRVPVPTREGASVLDLPTPPALRSSARISVPEADLDIQCAAAVLLKTSAQKDQTTAEAVFGIGGRPAFTWRPRVRKTGLEQAVYYCTVHTLATLQPGVIEVANIVEWQIAQGEIRELKLGIPAGMNVTAVQGLDIATWSFDPATRRLEALLNKGVSGAYRLAITAQVSCEGLPYTAKLGVPSIEGAARQRGALAVAAADTVQVRVDGLDGLSAMNVEDFSFAGAPVDQAKQAARPAATLRKAYRYDQPAQVTATVSAERVLPEVRVTENGTVSISDERTVYATQIELSMAKAGVFAVEIVLPEGFDVESLTGKDVSHWDEVKEGWRGIVVNFSRQVTDKTTLELVAARTEKGIEPLIELPRILVRDAKKHTGRLVVSGERGVRMMVKDHNGVDVKKPVEEGITQKGVLVFDILRPGWAVTLTTEVLNPVLKPEVLQVVDLTEGMLLCRAYVRYNIENAGIKSLRLQSPAPGVTLSVAGRNIARVQETDKTNGIWQVDLHSKVENQFALTVNYQVPYDRAKQKVLITALKTVGTDGQRGYVVVSCGGRVQIEPEGDLTGLMVEDPRNVPATFGAGDLSAAVRCYRVAQPAWELPLSVVRHESAQVLPATVKQVRMTSVLSAEGRILTRAMVQIDAGSLRLLKFTLPQTGDVLWTALVNGREVATSRDGAFFCIPLEEQAAGQAAVIDLVYSGASTAGRFTSRQKYEAPKFAGLPLRDIEWSFYVLPGVRYYGFGGTMERRADGSELVRVFGAAEYSSWNADKRNATLQKARQVLNDGEEMLKKGNSKDAMKAFNDAMNYSQAESGLNEDARVQLRNLQKQQVKVNLYQRRGAMRQARNIMEEQPEQQAQQTMQINAAPQQSDPNLAQSVDQILTEKDKTALEAVADRMIDQQAAAAGVVRAINVTIPEHGRLLRFYRPVLISPSEELSVTFKAGSGALSRGAKSAWPAGAVFLSVCVWMAVRRSRRA
jgi:hypothetical protein